MALGSLANRRWEPRDQGGKIPKSYLLSAIVLACLTLSLFAFATPLIAESASTDSSQWPEFRGPAGDGSTPEVAKLPLRWSENEAVKWKVRIRGRGWSSPVVWGEQIWVTTATEDGKQMFAICFDRNTGKVEHDLLVFENAEPSFCHPTNSYASPSPVIEAGRVYVHFGSYGTACLDTASGEKIWERRDFECDHWRGPGGSPILHDGKLHVAFDGYDVQFVVALNTSDGSTAWRTNRNIKYSSNNGDHRKAYGTGRIVQVGSGYQFISPSAEQTISYDPGTGRELWRVSHGGMNAATRPLYRNGLVYLTNGDSVGRIKPTLLAVRPELDVDDAKRIAWSADKSVPRRPSPAIVGNRLFMISDDGICSCLNATTGTQIWRKRIPGSFRASPLVSNGRIYLFSLEGKTTVIAAEDEFRELAENTLDNGCQASPAVAGNTILLRSIEHLYAIQ